MPHFDNVANPANVGGLAFVFVFVLVIVFVFVLFVFVSVFVAQLGSVGGRVCQSATLPFLLGDESALDDLVQCFLESYILLTSVCTMVGGGLVWSPGL